MANNGHQVKKSMVKAPPECEGQTTCLECTRPKCRYDEKPKQRKRPVTGTCCFCGKEFKKVRSNHKFCSRECSQKFYKLVYRTEYQRAYYLKNREKCRERNKAYYQAHKEELLEYNRKYRREHREQFRERNRKYRKEHREQIREYNRKYRREHKGAKDG